MDTRTRLIDTAADLFLAKGFSALPTSEICRVAGVNKGTLYHFFPSKTDLLVATIELYAERHANGFDRIARSAVPARDKLAALFDLPGKSNRAWKRSTGAVCGCLVGNMSLEVGSIDDTVRTAVMTALSRWRHAIVPVVEELIRDGELPDVDREDAAELLISMIQGGLVLAKATNDPKRVSMLAPVALTALGALPIASPGR